jgi:hypothetical protein
MPTVQLRPAEPGDAEFCYRLHRAALGPYVAQVWGWDEAEQRAYHRRSFRAAGRHGEGGRKVRLRAVPRADGAAPAPDRPR